MPIVLVGAGIGVTPLMAMAHAHLDRGPRAAPLRLIHCVRDGTSHPLRGEIEMLARVTGHPRFEARFFYSQPTAADRQSNQFHEEGRLTGDRLIAALADLEIELAGKTIPVPWYEADIYLCGPPSFLQQITEDLIGKGARPERLRTERFAPDSTPADGSDAIVSEGTEVHQAHVLFCRSGTEGLWLATEHQTLLQLAHSKGLELPFSCRSGYCQTCQCRIVEGEVRYEFAPLCAPAPRHALLCCARPASPVLVLDA
jgi:ferredoxin-NADP reductase